MKKLLDAIIAALVAKRPVVIVGVIASSGSTPRGAGATMAVFEDGVPSGTIGGGAVEYEATKQALTMFETKESRIASYTLAKSDVADLGMICGGDVTVFYEYLDPEKTGIEDLYRNMRAALDRNENAWLIRLIEDGIPSETAVYDGDGLRLADRVSLDEILPLLGKTPKLTDVGPAQVAEQVGNKIAAESGENPQDPASGSRQYYVEPLARAGRVYVFGGGHVSQELVPALSRVGFPVVVYEDRESFAKAELFPDATDIIHHDFDRISDKVTVDDCDYVVIMTRGHQKDFEVLDQMLRTQARYVGCIGSAKKLEATKKRLVEAGLPEPAFEKLFCPIGLKIKAETPAEIAISVAAEMIQFRAMG